MPNRTVRAGATGLPNATTLDLARGFIAACRAHGHRPYVSEIGRFGIMLAFQPAAVAPDPHPLGAGYGWTLGFDDRPYEALRHDPNYIAALILATREAAATADYVAGMDE